MKVAYFIAEYRSFTGSQRSLLYAMRAWQQCGGEVLAILPGEDVCAQNLRRYGIPTVVLPAPPSLHLFQRRLLSLPTWQKVLTWVREVLPYSWRIARLIRGENCSLLHCNSTRSILAAGWMPRLMGIPILLHIRGKQVEHGVLWHAAQWLSDRIIVVARHLSKEVHGRHQHKVRLLYNAVDIQEIETKSLDQSPLQDDQRSMIVSLASLIPGKGIHHLIRAAALVSKEFPSVLFAVAGGGEDKAYRDYISLLIANHCLGNAFHLLGQVPNPYPLIKQARMVVLASIDTPEPVPTDNPEKMPVGEGLPRSVLEGMAMRKPVVATNIEGADEAVVDGETGYLVPPANPEALASAILKLLRNPSLGEEMGIKGRERVERLFSMERLKSGLKSIYGELLGA